MLSLYVVPHWCVHTYEYMYGNVSICVFRQRCKPFCEIFEKKILCSFVFAVYKRNESLSESVCWSKRTLRSTSYEPTYAGKPQRVLHDSQAHILPECESDATFLTNTFIGSRAYMACELFDSWILASSIHRTICGIGWKRQQSVNGTVLACARVCMRVVYIHTNISYWCILCYKVCLAGWLAESMLPQTKTFTVA